MSFNIEVGKYYVRADGKIVKVCVFDPIDDSNLHYHCSDYYWRDKEGKVNFDPHIATKELNFVEEYNGPALNW